MADPTPNTPDLPTMTAPVQLRTVAITSDKESAAIASNALEVEDEFKPLYNRQNNGINLIEPPCNFNQLEKLVQENGLVKLAAGWVT